MTGTLTSTPAARPATFRGSAVADRVRQQLVHRARAEAARVELDPVEAAHRSEDLGALPDLRHERRIHLDPGDVVTEIAHAEVAHRDAGRGKCIAQGGLRG